MSTIDHRYDFVLLFDVQDGNPNGDPDAGNMPRFDPETGQGLVTDVCLKRKVRNFVETARPKREGYRIYIREGSYLNDSNEEPFKALQITALRNKRGKLEAPRESEDAVKRWMCSRFFDIRAFGAVMVGDTIAGQVRGPVQLTFARSEEPVFSRSFSITRMAATNRAEEEDRKADEAEGQPRTMGRKHTVAYGLYRGHGFVSAALADKTGFSEEDLRLLWEALMKMFEHDRSAARGLMSTRKLVVFEHSSKLGNAPAHELFERVRVTPRHEGRPARSFADYEVTLDGDPLDRLMTVVSIGGSV